MVLLYVFLGFIVLLFLSVGISYFASRNKGSKFELQKESRKTFRNLYHENSSKDVENVMAGAKLALDDVGITLSVDEILLRTYNSE